MVNVNVVRDEAKGKGKGKRHLLRIEPEDLQTLHSRSARQGDVALALLKHPAEIDLDALQGLALALVDGEGPCEDERNLMARRGTRRKHHDPIKTGKKVLA